MAASKIVGSIFFAANQLLGVEKLAVASSANLVDNSGFKVNEDGTRNMLARASFTEKCVEGVVSSSNSLVTGHMAIRLNIHQKKKSEI